ncbi:MAG: PLP-dependent aminotransferase family protein [Steroidobacteraceae bacterium]
MDLHIAVQGRHDLAGQIYRQLRAAIVEGRLAGGTQLPSTRDLALQLGVSRKTTLDVFERLLAEGFLYTRAGAGTFVAQGLQRLPAEPSAHARALKASTGAKAALYAQPLWDPASGNPSVGVLVPPQPSRSVQYDFIGGVTDMKHFPFDVWRRCMNHAMRAQARGAGAYREAAGEQELRLAVARYLAFNRAVASNWEDVIVTQGAQQALDLLARVTLRPGDVAAVEDPGYPPARAVFAAAGARVVPVPVDAQGLVVEQLPKDARLVYVTPSHQFPLGMPMSLARRHDLLAWASESLAWILEDDYDCIFRYDADPLPCLHALDPDGRVIYAGSFSKTLFPALRLGFLIVPSDLVDGFVRARMASDVHPPQLDQMILSEFITQGHYQRHIRRMQIEYAERLHTLKTSIERTGAALNLRPVHSGLHAVADLEGVDAERVFAQALVRNLEVVPLSAYHYGSGQARNGLLLGFGACRPAAIRAGMWQLAAAIDSARRSH